MYTINEALVKIQEKYPNDTITMIEQTNSSGFAWSCKFNDVGAVHYERLLPKGIVKNSSVPTIVNRMHIDMLRKDLYEKLLTLCATAGLNTIDNTIIYTWEDDLTFYIQGHHVTIPY